MPLRLILQLECLRLEQSKDLSEGLCESNIQLVLYQGHKDSDRS